MPTPFSRKTCRIKGAQDVMTLAERVYHWLICRPGYMLLTACDERLAAERPERFRFAWVGIMVLSAGCGVLLVNVWGWAWMVFGDYGLIIVPALLTVAVMVLWVFRRCVSALAGILGGKDANVQAAAAAMLVVMLTLGFLKMRSEYIKESLPFYLGWLRPGRDIYRVLFLMPIWGGWAMLIVGQFCRPNERTEPAVREMIRGCGPVCVAACMGVVLAATAFYFGFLRWAQLGISGAAIVTAVAGGIILCMFTGGVRRSSLLAVNLLTQLVLLMGYLANR